MTGEDYGLISALKWKPYMMPVSPWFYTNLPLSGKSHSLRSDTLWYQQWEQVLAANPGFV